MVGRYVFLRVIESSPFFVCLCLCLCLCLFTQFTGMTKIKVHVPRYF